MANTSTTTTTDPWLLNSDGTVDPFAANIDWHMPDLPDPDEPLPVTDPVLASQEGLNPEVVQQQPEPQIQAEPEPEGPEIMELEDGTTLSIEKEKGQWKGTVANSTGGNPQVYWGKTLKELIFNVLKAQANATRKIREQNLELKLGKAKEKPKVEPQQQIPTPAVRSLSPDEVFEIKTLLESNPELALDSLFQKKTGMNIQQLVTMAQQGVAKGNYANNILSAEQATKTFLQNNPDYYNDSEWENYKRIVKWVAKFKLGESVKKGEEESAFDKLVASGLWTVDNIEEAFQDLSNDDLLVKAPKKRSPQPPPVEVQTTEPTQPAPRPDPRIVKTEVRPRAALGIQRTDVTPVKPPEAQNAPSVEDLDNLPDDQIANLLNQIRRQRALGRRS